MFNVSIDLLFNVSTYEIFACYSFSFMVNWLNWVNNSLKHSESLNVSGYHDWFIIYEMMLRKISENSYLMRVKKKTCFKKYRFIFHINKVQDRVTTENQRVTLHWMHIIQHSIHTTLPPIARFIIQFQWNILFMFALLLEILEHERFSIFSSDRLDEFQLKGLYVIEKKVSLHNGDSHYIYSTYYQTIARVSQCQHV